MNQSQLERQMSDIPKGDTCDVAIIGGGPTGLAAAIALKKNGIEKVVVIDREVEAGGVPRYCGHPPFGIREFKRILTGPSYAKRIVQTAMDAGVQIVLKTTVCSLGQAGNLSLTSPTGSSTLQAKRVLLAMGTRETPRSARIVSGNRPLGIYNTGALQSMIYLKNRIPFKHPVIVGTEIVSFSALWTCRRAGIRPVAMLENKPHTTVRWPINYGAKLLGVHLFLDTNLENIYGRERVESVLVSGKSGNEQTIACDGVLFTGLFTPESSLARMSHLEVDEITGSPVVDQTGCCSDPAYYAAGNLLHKTAQVAGKCWMGGQTTAQRIVKDLSNIL